jgi:hypothetical protein
VNWDDEVTPGWRGWEQWLAEWHARRTGDCIPRSSDGPEDVRDRWEQVQSLPDAGAVFTQGPDPAKVARLSDAMSVRYTYPTRRLTYGEAVAAALSASRGDVRYEQFVPAGPSATDLGIVE